MEERRHNQSCEENGNLDERFFPRRRVDDTERIAEHRLLDQLLEDRQ